MTKVTPASVALVALGRCHRTGIRDQDVGGGSPKKRRSAACIMEPVIEDSHNRDWSFEGDV